MEKYNYLEEMKNDIRTYIEDRGIILTKENSDDLYAELYDDMFISDSITGNASGSYTFNAWKAEEYLCHNFDLLNEACEEFGCNAGEAVTKGAEYCDVTIRCYLLGEALTEVFSEL